MEFSQEIMENTKAWPFEQARAIVKRLWILEKRGTPHKGPIIFQTGYGPSGLPHIGTFGEVARTAMVRQAFNALTDNKYETQLIAFSDDMDGFRKVPSNVPNGEMLAEYIGKPLTDVPDPLALMTVSRPIIMPNCVNSSTGSGLTMTLFPRPRNTARAPLTKLC